MQKHLYDKVISYPRGKTIGGSSAINILGLVYPSRSSIDVWGKLGNKGWDWDSLTPYYRKFQTFNPPSAHSKTALGVNYIDESLQGKNGPIHSSYPEFVGPLVQAWPETLKNMGWDITGDPMSGDSLGGFSGPYTVNPNGVVRSHAGNEYLMPVTDRPNLHVQTHALVGKIEFADGTALPLHAQAVTFSVRDSGSRAVKAKKEIILAAGVFQTPQLLELSGIGNTKLLRHHGITAKLDNPNVGENLQDHAMSGMCAEVKEGVPTGDLRRDRAFLAKAREMYQQQRTGPLTAGFPSFAFLSLEGWADTTNLAATIDTLLNADESDNRPSRDEQQRHLRDLVHDTP